MLERWQIQSPDVKTSRNDVKSSILKIKFVHDVPTRGVIGRTEPQRRAIRLFDGFIFIPWRHLNDRKSALLKSGSSRFFFVFFYVQRMALIALEMPRHIAV